MFRALGWFTLSLFVPGAGLWRQSRKAWALAFAVGAQLALALVFWIYEKDPVPHRAVLLRGQLGPGAHAVMPAITTSSTRSRSASKPRPASGSGSETSVSSEASPCTPAQAAIAIALSSF